MRDMTSFVFINHRDPNNKNNIANPVVDIAALNRVAVLIGLIGNLWLGSGWLETSMYGGRSHDLKKKNAA